MADTPGYPDTNATMFIDPRQRLWLLWPTILANEWHTALMKYKISSDYRGDGPPRWDVSEVLHVTPGDEFKATVERELDRPAARPRRIDERGHGRTSSGSKKDAARQADPPARVDDARASVRPRRHAADRAALFRRLQLLADGDHATTGARRGRPARRSSGFGNIQPSIVRKKDGTLVAYMRDNGPRAQAAADQPLDAIAARRGARSRTRSLPNPGSGAEVLVARERPLGARLQRPRAGPLQPGRVAVRRRRRDVAVDAAPRTRSADDRPAAAGRVSLPVDHPGGRRHAARDLQLFRRRRPRRRRTREGRLPRKSIKHAHFNEAWIRSRARSRQSPVTGRSRKLEAGSDWRLATGDWRLATGDWKLLRRCNQGSKCSTIFSHGKLSSASWTSGRRPLPAASSGAGRTGSSGKSWCAGSSRQASRWCRGRSNLAERHRGAERPEDGGRRCGGVFQLLGLGMATVHAGGRSVLPAADRDVLEVKSHARAASACWRTRARSIRRAFRSRRVQAISRDDGVFRGCECQIVAVAPARRLRRLTYCLIGGRSLQGWLHGNRSRQWMKQFGIDVDHVRSAPRSCAAPRRSCRGRARRTGTGSLQKTGRRIHWTAADAKFRLTEDSSRRKIGRYYSAPI